MLLLTVLLGLAYFREIGAANTTCFGASFRTIAAQFQYNAFLQSNGCSLANTQVTRLFIQGACSKKHDNNFDGKPPPCPRGDWNVLDTSLSTCQAVFNHARPEDIRNPVPGMPFDSGTICNDGYTGIIFVQTDCPALNASSVKLMQQTGGPEFCWDGNTFSHAAFAGILAGGIVGVVLLFSIPIAYLLWRRRRRRLQATQVSPEDGIQGRKAEVVQESKGSFIAPLPLKSGGGLLPPGEAAYHLDAIPEEEGYDVEYANSETGTTPDSGIPVRNLAGQNTS